MTREILKIVAMIAMLIDHTAMVGLAGENWMIFNGIGRIAFPIFAFQVATGYKHTHNKKRYLGLMGIFAILSEIPYNLVSGSIQDPFRQNVMWTFFIAILMIMGIEKCSNFKGKTIFKKIINVVLILLILFAGLILGFITFVDYYGAGVLLVIGFYFILSIPKKKYTLLGQIILMIVSMYLFNNSLGGVHIEALGMLIQIQMCGMLALVPIVHYMLSGEKKMLKGKLDTIFKYMCYAFYPVHLVILYLIVRL